MKIKTFLGLILVATILAAAFTPRSSQGQSGIDDPLLTPVMEEIAQQQAALAENQTRIEEKLALIAEDIRVARIFVGRGGGKAGK